ncbi:MAG: hypothetical protein K5648_10155 [Erysipelotrichaceae bacterium]|nr:hypothetical protein [Erysipelotrichaceae bacterium]
MRKILLLIMALLLFEGCASSGSFDAGSKKEVSLESLKQKGPKYDGLLSVSYYRGGGMEIESQRIVLKKEDGHLLIENEARKGELCRVYTYEGNVNLFQPFEDLIEEYNLSVWDELEEREEIALDAPSTILTLGFENGETVIDYDDQFPQGGYEVINRLVKEMTGLFGICELKDVQLLKDGASIGCGKTVDNTDEEIFDLVWGRWQDEEESVYLYERETMQIFPHDGSAEKDYDLKQIVHEPLDVADASWHLIYENTGDASDRRYLSIDQGRLYMKNEEGELFRGDWY